MKVFVVIVISILLKPAFWQTLIHSQSLVKIFWRSDKDKITFKAAEKHRCGLRETVKYRNTLKKNNSHSGHQLNPLSPNSAQNQFSPNDTHRLSWAKSMRIFSMSKVYDHKEKNISSFTKFSQFSLVCVYWDLIQHLGLNTAFHNLLCDSLKIFCPFNLVYFNYLQEWEKFN